MAISTYAELQTAVANWLDRTDLTARIPEFIALSEAKMNRQLRLQFMETEIDIIINEEKEALPTGFRSAKRFYLDTNPRVDLQYISPFRLNSTDLGSNSTNDPVYFTYSGNNFQFRPIPDSGVTGKLLYFKAIDPLDTTPTNTLLTNSPDIYLYGALAEAGPFLIDQEVSALYLSLFNQAMLSAQDEDDKNRTSGAVLQPVASGSTP